MSIGKEFKEFVMRGNVLDLAVGVIIGGAFGKIVASLTNDLIMPPIGMILGKVDFSSLYVALDGKTYATLAEAKKAAAPTLNYGVFINSVLDFVIVAFVIFLLVRWANKLKKEPPPADPTTKNCSQCLSEIPIAAKKCKFCTSEIIAA